MEENKKTEPSKVDQDKVDQRHKLGRLRIDIKRNKIILLELPNIIVKF